MAVYTDMDWNMCLEENYVTRCDGNENDQKHHKEKNWQIVRFDKISLQQLKVLLSTCLYACLTNSMASASH